MSRLIVKNVSKKFGGIQALHDVSATFSKDAITGLIGPNGSGKTTLLNCIAGTYSPNHGSISYEGIETSSSPQAAYYAGVTRTFQASRLFGQLTVMENLLLVTDERRVMHTLKTSQEANSGKAIQEVLKRLGIEDKKRALAQDLSYGQKRLVELAKVILSQKPVILLDEPFAGLFAATAAAVKKLLRELKNENKIVIIVEHNPKLIQELCDTVIVLDAGEVIAAANPAEVFRLKVVREAYLGE